MTHTCATCPFARHIDRDRYSCGATHNHHNPIVRGHWEATADCESAVAQVEIISQSKTDDEVDYLMQLEADLEKAEARTIQKEQYFQVAAAVPLGIEVDSIKADSYRIWSGTQLLGTMRRTSAGWMARPVGGIKSWHSSSEAAQRAVAIVSCSYQEADRFISEATEVEATEASKLAEDSLRTQTLTPSITWDEASCIHVASQMLLNAKELELFQSIGTEQFLNHLSTVFYVPSANENPPHLAGVEIAIHVGQPSPDLQRRMRSSGIRGLVGMTPQFPCSNPQASPPENLRYIQEFEQHLLSLGVAYLPAWGRARDFREGAGGCFILLDVTPDEASSIIKDQLSYTYLPANGVAQLISL